nr:helix-turn-helix domain-containing protein [Streptomyces cupreus]
MGAAQVAAHALDAGVVEVDLTLVTVVSLLVPVALWRTHALARHTPRDATPPATVPPVPEQTPTVQPPAAVTLDRVGEQDAPETPELPPGTDQDTEDAEASPPALLTSKDVAELFGVDPSTVRSWVHSGRLEVHDKDARGHNLFHPDNLPQEART